MMMTVMTVMVVMETEGDNNDADYTETALKDVYIVGRPSPWNVRLVIELSA